jgi:hypothetical protein
VVQDGKVVAEAVDPKGARRLSLRSSVKVQRNTWLSARVGAERYDRPVLFADAWARGVMAHSSPIYVACGEHWSMFDRAISEDMLRLVDMSSAYVREMGLRWPQGTVTHHHSHIDHDAFLSKPFQEARDAIMKRLDK